MTFLKRHWRSLFVLAVTLMLVICILVYKPRLLPAGYFSTPTPPPADIVDFEELAQPVNEPELFEGAVTVLANGAPILTLEDAATATALLEWRLNQAEIPEDETLLYVEFFRDITLRYAIEGEVPVGEDEGKAALIAKGTCPVRVVTRSTKIERVPYKSEQTEDKRLPKGMRMVLTLGREGENISVNEYGYIDGIRQVVPISAKELARSPVDELVAVGAYASSKSPAGEDEGEKGPAAPEGFKLKAPVSGKVAVNFGMAEGVMNNGLSYTVKIGDKVTAPEAGTVIFARERAGFGFLVEIDHGGGFVTRMAPVAQFGSSVGDKVEKGQEIGKVDAPKDEDADPFFYMELLIDGIPYNPRRY